MVLQYLSPHFDLVFVSFVDVYSLCCPAVSTDVLGTEGSLRGVWQRPELRGRLGAKK